MSLDTAARSCNVGVANAWTMDAAHSRNGA